MRNPLRSEAEAFRFLIIVIVGAAVIVVAAYINTWLGVAVAVLAFAALGWWLVKEPVPGAHESARVLASGTPPGMRRVLIVAPPGTESVAVPDGAEVLVVDRSADGSGGRSARRRRDDGGGTRGAIAWDTGGGWRRRSRARGRGRAARLRRGRGDRGRRRRDGGRDPSAGRDPRQPRLALRCATSGRRRRRRTSRPLRSAPGSACP